MSMSVTRHALSARRAKILARLASAVLAAGLMSPDRALALTAGDLAETCAFEATISNADPRYGTGLCQLHLDAVLNDLRQTMTCATPVTTHQAESQASTIFQGKLHDDPALAGQDADKTARQALAQAFDCQTEK